MESTATPITITRNEYVYGIILLLLQAKKWFWSTATPITIRRNKYVDGVLLLILQAEKTILDYYCYYFKKKDR